MNQENKIAIPFQSKDFNKNAVSIVSFVPWEKLIHSSLAQSVYLKEKEQILGVVADKDGIKVYLG